MCNDHARSGMFFDIGLFRHTRLEMLPLVTYIVVSNKREASRHPHNHKEIEMITIRIEKNQRPQVE